MHEWEFGSNPNYCPSIHFTSSLFSLIHSHSFPLIHTQCIVVVVSILLIPVSVRVCIDIAHLLQTVRAQGTRKSRATVMISEIMQMYANVDENGDSNNGNSKTQPESERREVLYAYLQGKHVSKQQQAEARLSTVESQSVSTTAADVIKNTMNAACEAVASRLKAEFKDVCPDSLPAGVPPGRGHELSIKLKPNSKPPARVPR